MERLSVCGIHIKNGKFLLAKRKVDNSKMSGRWEFIGGKVEQCDNDDYKSALAREFLEEVGINISVCEYLSWTKFINKGKKTKLLAFRIDISEDISSFKRVEHEEFGYFHKSEIKKLKLVDSDKNVFLKILKSTQ